MQSVFAKFFPQFIGNIVKGSDLFRLQGIIKKSVLNGSIRLQIEQNNSRGAINIFWTIAGAKEIMDDIRKLERMRAGARELGLTADSIEIILLEKDNDFIGG